MLQMFSIKTQRYKNKVRVVLLDLMTNIKYYYTIVIPNNNNDN